MDYILMIAEKPDAMRRIAQALAEGNTLQEREEKGVDYYEFERDDKKHVIVAAVGHLFVLHNKSKGWIYPAFDYNWMPTFKVNRKASFAEKYYNVIEKMANGAMDHLVCCDFDTEGSVIGANILRFLCGVKDGRRMKFSTLVKEELIDSYEKASPHLDFGQIEAGLTRHELDFIYGINLTRALTLSMKKKAERAFSILSTGRVQGPTLSCLMDKELEIRRFVSIPYWQIEIHCVTDGSEIVALHEKEKFWEKSEAEDVYRACLGKDANVEDLKRRRYKQRPPVPFNTTDLQAETYKHFKYSPAQTLGIAESLYQMGAISYPRSSSQKLPPNIGYKRIIEALSHLKKYKKLCDELLKKKLMPKEGKKEDPAHPAIYPTFETPDLKTLNAYQKKLYDLIVRRFMSVFADVAVRESLRVTLDVDGNRFSATGRRTIKPGWTMFYSPYLAFEDQPLPDLKEGQILRVRDVVVLDKETQPPKRYSQGSIVKEMEDRNLGTRATRAEILKTLYDRRYIKGKSIRVTKLGETVVGVLKDFCPRILREDLTKRFEEEMDLVMQEKKERVEVVEEAKQVLTDVLADFKSNDDEIGKRLLDGFIKARREERRLGVCPKCGGELRITASKASGKIFAGCSSYPDCTNSYPLPGRASIEALGKICEECGTPIIRVFRKRRRPFTMCLDPNCPTKAEWKKRK